MAVTKRPRIDRTGLGAYSFYLDGPCGAGGSYGSGRLYQATRRELPGGDWQIRWVRPSVEGMDQARHLLDYLRGPRDIRITVVALGAVSFDDREIAEFDTGAPGRTDPDDHAMWRDWLLAYAQRWLHEPPTEPRVPDDVDRLYFAAADTNAVDLNGIKGLARLYTMQLNRHGGEWVPAR